MVHISRQRAARRVPTRRMCVLVFWATTGKNPERVALTGRPPNRGFCGAQCLTPLFCIFYYKEDRFRMCSGWFWSLVQIEQEIMLLVQRHRLVNNAAPSPNNSDDNSSTTINDLESERRRNYRPDNHTSRERSQYKLRKYRKTFLRRNDE